MLRALDISQPLLVSVLLIALGGGVIQALPPPPLKADEAIAETVFQWKFVRDHLAEPPADAPDGPARFTPLAGLSTAEVVGELNLADDAPGGIVLAGKAKIRQHLALDYDAAKAALPKEAITVEAWLQIDEPVEWGGIIGYFQDNGGYERGVLLGYQGAKFSFALASEKTGRMTYLTASEMFDPGQWYHVVGTYDGRAQRLFVDGKLAAASTEQQGRIHYPPAAAFTLGAYLDADEYYPLAGRIESAAVLAGALSEEEVKARFEARKEEFPGIVAQPPRVTGWPTYLRDNQRTGVSDERLTLPLQLNWMYQARHLPRPAWPPPAKQDFWNRKHDLKARVVYDRAFHLISDGRSIYFGSSANDRVYCLDAETGRERWTFCTEGPVRLAPTLEGERLLFGSDDGCVYCLQADGGELLWKRRLAERDRRIVGNGRLISDRPCRSGLLVESGVAYVCTGLLPTQGVERLALDVATGHEIDRQSLQVAAQGYLERRASQLFVATGNDPAGSFLKQLERRGKSVGPQTRNIPEEFPFAFIGCEGVRLGGGDGQVAAFDANDGRLLWSAKVEGAVYSLAIAGGRLFASTDQGFIYCFAADAMDGEPSRIAPHAQPLLDVASIDQKQVAAVAKALAACDSHKGFCLLWGVDKRLDLTLVHELTRNSEFQIVVVAADERHAAALRRQLFDSGLDSRTCVHVVNSTSPLPYADYLFNLVIAPGSPTKSQREESHRVTRPYGGVTVLGTDAEREIVRRGSIPGAGEWSHMHADPANTVCSGDAHVNGPLDLLWIGGPGPRRMIDRHHRTVAPLWKQGRLFIPGDDRVIAVDAYNGTELWDRALPYSRRIAAFRDCSYLAAGDERLFAAVQDRCLALDAKTGQTVHEYPVPLPKTREPRHWGYVASADELLIGSATKLGASRREISREVAASETYWDFVPIVCSESLFALDAASGQSRWLYRPLDGAILNPTIAAGDGRVIFVESKRGSDDSGRGRLRDLLAGGGRVTALEQATGRVAWSIPLDLSRLEHNVFLACAQGKVVVVGSRNDGIDQRTARVAYDVLVFNAADGARAWSHSQNQGTEIGGDHGEQDHRPVIVGDTLICEPWAYELASGKPRDGWSWRMAHRRGCGQISASAGTLFCRDDTATMFDLADGRYQKVCSTVRPGCWINLLPVGGLLLAPEASSGCTCDYAVQSSLGFIPRRLSAVRPDEAE